jgi:hypothetical protein
LITSPPIEWPINTIGFPPPERIWGEIFISASKVLPKSCTFKKLSLVSPQSALYPKVWMLTFLKAGSRGSQFWGQNFFESLPFLHVLMEPPRRPWTKMKSTKGSAAKCNKCSPRGPLTSSMASLARRRKPQTWNLRSGRATSFPSPSPGVFVIAVSGLECTFESCC